MGNLQTVKLENKVVGASSSAWLPDTTTLSGAFTSTGRRVAGSTASNLNGEAQAGWWIVNDQTPSATEIKQITYIDYDNDTMQIQSSFDVSTAFSSTTGVKVVADRAIKGVSIIFKGADGYVKTVDETRSIKPQDAGFTYFNESGISPILIETPAGCTAFVEVQK